MSYYQDKEKILQRLFGVDLVEVTEHEIRLGTKVYPIINDVIVTLPRSQWPASLAEVENKLDDNTSDIGISAETQYSFGIQWNKFSEILPEHKNEFNDYFDLIDLSQLQGKTVLDLGCGMGRWSWFLSEHCGTLVLVDFSDAIFAARHTLEGCNAIFIMGDIHDLPLAENCADFLFSLGVLHHMPSNCLEEVRALGRLAPQLLIYLYYALDNRPIYFKFLFNLMARIRCIAGSWRNERARAAFVAITTITVYYPLAKLSCLMGLIGCSHLVPLHWYGDKSFARMQQDAYDKLLTRIEQRVSREEIILLRDTFSGIRISEKAPYWHFVCDR